MGHSDIQGWGLYMGEDVKTNEFLGEYKGEIVSKTEGDRRGAVYHYRGIEYLFGLNKCE
jgi:histone-lysine N-methyltransferase EZH2